MTDVQGRTAFITGGANGIGLGIARSLARKGVKLALVDLDAEALERAKAELQDQTAVETFRLDVSDRDAYAAVAEEAERALGPVSLLFSNAGVAGGVPAAKITYEMWDWYIGINLYGVINGIQNFLPKMVERGQGGHIVNTASGAGLVATGGPLYSSTKFAVVGMSEALHLELEATDIGISVLCPGPVATDIMRRTAMTTPSIKVPLTDEQRERANNDVERATEWLKQGTSIDDVGEMVLKAVQDNSLYIHTDRFSDGILQQRSKAIIDAMPS